MEVEREGWCSLDTSKYLTSYRIAGSLVNPEIFLTAIILS